MRCKLISILILLSCGLNGFAEAPEAVSGSQSTAKGLTPQAELVTLASSLIKYGYRTESALPLIQALEIYNRLGINQQDLERTSKGSTILPGKEASISSVSYSRDQIIADATVFADGDKDILTLLNGVKSSRGMSVNLSWNQCFTVGRLKGRNTDTYTYCFNGGSEATVIVNGNGDTDLDLYIYDNYGNFVTQDIDSGDQCMVLFSPREAETYTIKVVNMGQTTNQYALYIQEY